MYSYPNTFLSYVFIFQLPQEKPIILNLMFVILICFLSLLICLWIIWNVACIFEIFTKVVRALCCTWTCPFQTIFKFWNFVMWSPWHYSITVTNVPLCSVIWTHNSSRVPHRSVQMLVAFHIPVSFASSQAVPIEHPQRWVFWVVRCVFSGLPRGTKFLYLWCRSWNLALTASWEFSEFDVAAVSSCSMHCHLTRWTPHLQLSELAVF